MRKVTVLLLIMLLATGCVPVSVASSLPKTWTASPDPRLAGLWIDMSMGPQVVDLFNLVATDQDIARADHVSMVDLLDKVKVGQKLVVFKTAADAELLVPRLADKIDIIGFNLEHGPTDHPEEQADPVGSVQRIRRLADQYGLKVMLGPDRAFALSDGSAMAPYVDLYVLQVQRAQTEPETVREFVVPLVHDLLRANPNLGISVQVRTEGDVKALADLLAMLKPELDGVSILTSPETVPVAEALVAELRAPVTELPTPLPQSTPVKSSVPAQAAVLETPTPAMRRTGAIAAVATPSAAPVTLPAAADETLALRTLLLLAGLIGLGVIVVGLLATVFIYSYQNFRAR
ncbi:MAG: hypothetical protein IT329_20440 [Caldilineaceae bacterium]|nr:hypothetical protein [Caldilineaceae bacterium]